jgi:hypothetical protein
MRRLSYRLALIAIALLIGACSQSTEPEGAGSTGGLNTAGGVQPMCQAGCIDIDPNPTSPGIFLGSAVTPDLCLTPGIQTDVDLDGLSDFCEKQIAAAFAPWMRYRMGDDVGYEGYWAARARSDSDVSVLYAFGYYIDLGVVETEMTACRASTLGEILAECDGHHGDAEAVVLDVRYNTTTSHWVLVQADYSTHTDYLHMDTGPKGYALRLQYKTQPGGAPIVWVATYKHANYPTQQTCDAGGGAPWPLVELFPFDTCEGADQWFRADAQGTRNLGSNGVRLIDCVYSMNPFYQDPAHPPECFWSWSRFYGWDIDHSTYAEPGYGSRLRSFGF